MYSLVALLLASLALALPAPQASSSSLEPTVFTGRATWFEVGLGACGYTDTDADYVVALNAPQYTSGDFCNRFLLVSNSDTGASAVAKVRDECPGCAEGSLDMSPDLFKALSSGGLDEGVFPISWQFYENGWQPAN
ncbi:barwin-like endoglucanase [Dacryopinax primogenitus]|uniref:Barwin-like endoglucanase n=1 Tax=Dacryopinax primogenitus (strain DJM 731) TaxID=1858805 RepID=M5FT15_DACPD|nr:barwin-like endoglucanase [Dacryopinax primogenitus]EJT98499.1 barwin-like endoglucanase [Dacryopinax primogenitus]